MDQALFDPVHQDVDQCRDESDHDDTGQHAAVIRKALVFLDKVADAKVDAQHFRTAQAHERAPKAAGNALGSIDNDVREMKGVKYVAKSVEGVDMNALRELGDKIKEKIGGGVVVLASSVEGKVNLIAMAADDAVAKGAHAGNLIKAIAAHVGGGGGGKPNMAQAGGKNPAGIPDALAAVDTALESQLK